MSEPRELSELEAARRDRITKRADAAFEKAGNYEIPVVLDTLSATILIGQLQLALRHPGNVGPSAKVAKEFVQGLIERLPEGARELRMLGFDPRYDA